MTSGEYVLRQVSRYREPFILWLAGAVIFVIGLVLIAWPGRDVDPYLGPSKVQNVEIDLQTRRVEADIRYYRSEGLTDDQIKKKLVTFKNVDPVTIDNIFEFEKDRESNVNVEPHFNGVATIVLAPPVLILEFGVAWLFALGFRAWRNRHNKDLRRTT